GTYMLFLDIVGQVLDLFPLVIVGGTHLDGLETAQYVRLHHHQFGDPVDLHGISEGNQVQPATASGPSGGGAKLISDPSQGLPVPVKEFGGKWTTAHPGGIGFENAHYLANFIGSDPQPNTGTGSSGIG